MLIISAVFLGWESRLFGNSSVKLSALFNLAEDGTAGYGNGDVQDSIKKAIGEPRPVSVAVTGSTGAHYGAKYRLDEIGLVYNMTAQIVGEALGSAQTPTKADEQSWRAALTSPGIYYEYMSPMPLSVLVGWFGEDVAWNWEDLPVRRLCVAEDDGKNRLYFQDDITGAFYSADTAIKADSLTIAAETYAANNAYFAFEIISTPALKAPYVLLMPDVSDFPLIEVTNPLNEANKLVDVLQYLNVSEHRKPIIYADGTREYIENDFTIKIAPDGTVGYIWKGSEEASPAQMDVGAAIELARRAVSDSIGSYCGDAKIYFDAVDVTGENEYHVMFKYVIAGGQIYIGRDGYAAKVVIINGAIREMELHFRTYTKSDEPKKLLPEIQAAAAAGGMFMLCYSDSGNDLLEPSWVEEPPNLAFEENT